MPASTERVSLALAALFSPPKKILIAPKIVIDPMSSPGRQFSVQYPRFYAYFREVMTKKNTEDEADKRDDDPTADLEILPEARHAAGRSDDWNQAINDLSIEMQLLVDSVSRKQQDTEELLKLCLSEIESLKSQMSEDGASKPVPTRMIVACESEPPNEYAIGPGNLSLGSCSDNDIQIDNTYVSRHHAEIVSSSTECVLRDLNSTNGTFVNSKRIKRHALKNGDQIILGRQRFAFVDKGSHPSKSGQGV